MAKRGLILAAPSSGAGKTTITLGLLRALRQQGISIAGAKCGPDYIDPAYHAAATGKDAVNLDAWAMPADVLKAQASQIDAELLLIEGAMGVLDGAGLQGKGSVADLAQTLNLPVVLILDTAKQSHSVTLAPLGLKSQRPEIKLAGVILNRVGSPRHLDMLRTALNAQNIEVLGAIPRTPDLHRPERHLGLVQAREHDDLSAFLDQAANIVGSSCNMDRLVELAAPIKAREHIQTLSPLGQRISIARDDAFSFAYPHMLEGWRKAGAEIRFFSPLADEAPLPDADAIFLPGGYPELHAGKISTASAFRTAMHAASKARTLIYGECGGYMALGEALVDSDGTSHEMLGLLPLCTSFARRKLMLGYRRLQALPGAPWQGTLRAHEFHYATILQEAEADKLFDAEDADGTSLPAIGLRRDTVSGSFAHIIAQET